LQSATFTRYSAYCDTPTELKIIITPPFWQTTWLRILVALVIAGIIYSFYRYRIGQILLLQGLRNKIAADLHDDIGSTLNSISVYSELAKQEAGKPIPSLDDIGAGARRIVESMSDIVWTINPENDNFDKVIARMRSFTHPLLSAKKIEYSFKADEGIEAIKLPMQVRKNVYLIFKEAITNLVKYSQAQHAQIQISRAGKNIRLVVCDDGKGFDSSRTTFGNGIKNMNRRAKEVKAQLLVNTQAGSGTAIELIFKT